jgi:tetratricopeptide (TPR) repeat protein
MFYKKMLNCLNISVFYTKTENTAIMCRIVILVLLFTTIQAFPQQGTYNFEKAEKEAGKLIFSAPDKSLVLIKQTLSQPGLHDTLLGKTYTLYSRYFSVKEKPDSVIRYAKKSLGYLQEYPKLKAAALLTLSTGYRDKGKLSDALEVIHQALALYTKNKYKEGIAAAYSEMAVNYSYMQNPKQEADYLLKAIAILKTTRNATELNAVYQKLANAYMDLARYKQAIPLYRACAPVFKKAGDFTNYHLVLINLGVALTQTGNYAEAEGMLLKTLESLKSKGDKELTGITQAKLAELNNSQGKNTQALSWYSQAVGNMLSAKSDATAGIAGPYIEMLNNNGSYNDALKVIERVKALKLQDSNDADGMLAFTQAMAKTYKGLGKTAQAIDAYQRTLALMDTLNNIKSRGAVEEIQAKYQTEIQREKNLRLQADNNVLTRDARRAGILLWVYIGTGVAVLILVLLFLRSSLLKNALQREELKGVEAERNLIEQQHLHEQELIDAQKKIISEKQQELTSTALRMANYQDSIKSLIDKLDNNEVTKINDAKRELQNLVKQQDYWKQFETRFNSLHPEFGSSLSKRFDKLTKNDIEFCSLLKLNLSNKEIASLLQISHESVITKKYRIKKKMEITDDDEFDNLLMDI